MDTGIPTKKIFGEQITPIIFNEFKFRGGTLTIPVDAWDIDLASPPYIQAKKNELLGLEQTGLKSIEELVDYIAEFAKEFERLT